MCYFATIAIPSTTAKEIGIPKRRGFHVFPYQNPHLAKTLPAGHATLAFTSGGCSCDICKPMGEDKISVSLRADAADFLRDITKSHGDLYLFIHWYSGDISTETLSPKSGTEVTLDQIGSIPFHHDRWTKIKNPNNAIHRMATRVTPPADSASLRLGRSRATGSCG